VVTTVTSASLSTRDIATILSRCPLSLKDIGVALSSAFSHCNSYAFVPVFSEGFGLSLEGASSLSRLLFGSLLSGSGGGIFLDRSVKVTRRLLELRQSSTIDDDCLLSVGGLSLLSDVYDATTFGEFLEVLAGGLA
jgi:hypothetical protein